MSWLSVPLNQQYGFTIVAKVSQWPTKAHFEVDSSVKQAYANTDNIITGMVF